MSLVYEALQKAEREKQRKAGIVAPPAPPLTPLPVQEPKPVAVVQPQPAPTRSTQSLLVGLMSTVCVVALVAIVYLVVNATRPAAAPVTSSTTGSVTKPADSTPPSTPASQSATPSSSAPAPSAQDARYRVTGIMRNPEGKFCAVLNGKIVYDGYYVDGATVKSVSQDRVVLDVAGRESVVGLY